MYKRHTQYAFPSTHDTNNNHCHATETVKPEVTIFAVRVADVWIPFLLRKVLLYDFVFTVEQREETYIMTPDNLVGWNHKGNERRHINRLGSYRYSETTCVCGDFMSSTPQRYYHQHPENSTMYILIMLSIIIMPVNNSQQAAIIKIKLS